VIPTLLGYLERVEGGLLLFMTAKKRKPWGILLFGLPFAGVGLGMLFFSVLPTLYDGLQMSTWPTTPARVISAELQTHRGDSTTYEALGHYRYSVNGQSYTGSRLGISSSADNVGDWHQRIISRLSSAQRNQSPIPVYYNPQNPSEAIVDPGIRWSLVAFKMIFVLVFGGAGVGLICWAMHSHSKIIDTPSATAKPWLGHKDWASPVLRSDARKRFYVAWLFALFWNLMSAPVLFAIPGEWAKGNHAILLAALFPLVGVGLIVWGIRSTQRWLRIGATPLTMDPYPGSIGGQVGGTIATNLPFQSGQRFPLVLSCVYSYMSGSGKSRKCRERVEWSAEGYADVEPAGRGTRLSFRFDVPPALPTSELSDERYHFWRLNLRSEGGEVNLDRNFELPVFATAQNSAQLQVDSTAHPLAREEQDQHIDQVMSMEQTSDGLALEFPVGRNGALNGGMAAFGAFFFAAGVFAGNMGAPLPMAAIFCLLGGGIALGGLYGLLNRLEVRLSQESIHTRRSLLGVVVRKTATACSEVRQLRIHRTGSTTSGNTQRVYFAVRAHRRDGKQITIAESLVGQGAADQVAEALAFYSGLHLDATPVTARQLRAERKAKKS
jgi:Protein of unknown function (DUF3592)